MITCLKDVWELVKISCLLGFVAFCVMFPILSGFYVAAKLFLWVIQFL